MLALRTLALSAALVAITAAGSIFAAPATAQVRQTYYSGGVRNDLGFKTFYEYSYNGGPWQLVWINPGVTQYFAVPSAYSLRTAVWIRYDTRMNDRQTTWSTPTKLMMLDNYSSPYQGHASRLTRVNRLDVLLMR